MYLSGSLDEIRSILLAAEDLRATAIHFIAPDKIFILANNKEDYIYVRTRIIIGQSIYVPKTTYQNILIYLRGAKRGVTEKGSIFYGRPLTQVLLTSNKMMFNDDKSFTIEHEFVTAPLKKDVEFKMADTFSLSGYHMDLPYLQMPVEELKQIIRTLYDRKLSYSTKAQRSSDNAIRIEKGFCVLYFKNQDKDIRIETLTSNIGVPDNFKSLAFTFSDRALYLMRWLMNNTQITDVVFLPRNGYCILEGLSSGLVAKVRTLLKNDLAM